MDKFKEVLEKNTTDIFVDEPQTPEKIHTQYTPLEESFPTYGLKNTKRVIPIPTELRTKRWRNRYLRFLQTNLQSYPKEAIEFSKVIKQHGRSRSYYLNFVKKLIDFDFILLDKSVGVFKLRKFELEGLERETIYM